jgi:hypothetical protein
MRTLRLITVSLALTVLFTTPWKASAATSRENRVLSEKRVETALPAILSHTWAAIKGILTKVGCNIGPSGICSPEPTTINQLDAGCNIDPDGRCHSN